MSSQMLLTQLRLIIWSEKDVACMLALANIAVLLFHFLAY